MPNKKRLIDAFGLTIRLSKKNAKRPLQYDDVLAIIADEKTVDAVEVVHGHWERIEDDYFDLVNLKCSVCGEEWCFEDYDDCLPQNYRYCPNCGAKMDGGEVHVAEM